MHSANVGTTRRLADVADLGGDGAGSSLPACAAASAMRFMQSKALTA
jgi:hypothetical protein